MFKSVKESINTIIKMPILTMFFIIFLIILSFCMQNLANLNNTFLSVFTLVLILFFNSAFFAGWFNMAKSANAFIKIENKNIEEELNTTKTLKGKFFEAIPTYILPVFTIIILYYIAFFLWLIFNYYVATHTLGSIQFLIDDLPKISQNTEMIQRYFLNLDKDKFMILFYWQIWFTSAISIFGIFTIFIPPALYYNESNNPIYAILKAFIAIFKKPLEVLGFNIFVGVFLFLLMIIANISSINQVLSFIYLVFSIYAIVFLVVLLFNYYEKLFCQNNCNNGTDCNGEIKSCD